ncbi:MAG: 2-oxoglutarate/2-oxoacid ferredoxin oxidoreductase subunit alpha, partial [Thermoanaerobaculia bacterium]|nr:2-oxoglutarate/2-oxoacid ferredoxin oxidoreductase subunit alpha [Thermoanaerobaculia bacterium]
MSDSMTATAVLDEPVTGAASIVNDCTIHVATVNGSGSQSSNNVLMRSIFQMGVPVSGKNMFPSNIAGLPTWFTIRANKDGWIARKK